MALPGAVKIFSDCTWRDLRQGRAEELNQESKFENRLSAQLLAPM
jgi:hypothetical protein